ncbi:hypothetical protein TCAL_10487 [Tigriopus californicus]|uniref:C2H2-type domain-containing protein n=1 Tax=Tigriopus californicus TaxID=6832 RepID=A0A553PS10_TIGCA|nr:hypothetical protein TCAL_10487 [Tigriopus californicus]
MMFVQPLSTSVGGPNLITTATSTAPHAIKTETLTLNIGTEGTEYECTSCDYKSPRRSNVNQHIKTVHDRIRDFACQQCPYKSSRRSNLANHVKTVHDNIKDFLCRYCDFKSSRKYNIVQHINRVHRDDIGVGGAESGFTLDPPTMVVSNTSTANMTQIVNSNAQPQMNYAMSLNYDRSLNFSCGPLNPPVPSLNYLQPLTNIDHPVINVGPQFSQPQSTYTVNPSPAQQVSQQVTVQTGPAGIQTVGNGKDEFHCQLCSYKCAKKKTPALPTQPQPPTFVREKNFACQYCEFRTAYRRNLNSHVNEVHLKERREHKCHLCDFKSTRRSNLTQHIKSIHERIRDHSCWLCGFTSSRKKNVEKHVMTMHIQKDENQTGTQTLLINKIEPQ